MLPGVRNGVQITRSKSGVPAVFFRVPSRGGPARARRVVCTLQGHPWAKAKVSVVEASWRAVNRLKRCFEGKISKIGGGLEHDPWTPHCATG